MRKIALNPKKAVIKGLFVMRTKRYALFIFRAYYIWSTSSWQNDSWKKIKKLTAFKLFHNHLTIELLEPFFGLVQ
jgi:hypothetical protein